MNLRSLLNRDFKLPADHVYQLVPKGEHPIVIEDDTGPKRIIQVVDDASLASMAEDLKNRAAQPNWAGMLVDFDHFSCNTEKPSAAGGWALENSTPKVLDGADAGLWGVIRWSNSGKTAVEGGDYKFLSPVLDAESAVPLGGNRYRIMKIDRLALTNDPNMKGMVPLSNRSPLDRANNQPNQTAMLPRLTTLLALSATSTEDQVVDAIRGLQNRASQVDSLKDTHVPKSEHTALQNRYDKLIDGQLDATLDKFENRFGKDNRDKWKNRLKADFDGTVELLEGLPEAAEGTQAAPKKPLHNRDSAKTPTKPATEGDKPTAAQKIQAAKIRNRARELQKLFPNRGWNRCWNDAEAELGTQAE